MKKLSTISNQIKNNTFSYTGKGAYEAVANKQKANILKWLEDLVPLQKQIENIIELENIEIQKRNYTRILTKIAPLEYKEFVSINILVRDANKIAKYYDEDYDLTKVYSKLIENRYLKYPGKYEKFVEFELFQKFVMLYRDDLISSVEEINDSDKIDIQTVDENSDTKENNLVAEEINQETSSEEELEEVVKPIKKETNWTNLLLGKLK
ncbi:MAG: hypothetical protein U9O56_09710 [Campylobacterota bacterium]|nr:hypothetical protein [Campylobacterota bacterium]